MDIEIIRRLNLARHLYQLSALCLRTKNDVQLFSSVNLLQDSVEAFLISVADFTKADINQNTTFDKYFTLIDAKINPKVLPFKTKLIRLNKIRISSKHYGIQPARDECDRLILSVREFFDEVCTSILNVNFSTVSAIDLLPNSEVKTLLDQARTDLETGNHIDCAINCRKALFLKIEKPYDIASFKDNDMPGLFGAFSTAPSYAKSKQYIEESVKDPTDYIVYDFSSINEKLLTFGADNTAFWNVWRLTPEVYKTKTGEWIIKYEFNKLNEEILKDKIDYIFSATVDVILSINQTSQATQWADHSKQYLELNSDNVPVYFKADTNSKISYYTPSGMTRIDTDYRVEGLNDAGPYWHVFSYEQELIIKGFIHNNYVKN